MIARVKHPNITLAALTKKIEQQADFQLAERVSKAYMLAEELYGSERNMAALTKLDHGLLSAETVLDLCQDGDAVLAAIFNHVSDADQIELVEREFGHNVSELIGGLRKLDIYTNQARKDTQRTLEAIRRAVFSIIDGDVRVVMIRLAMAVHTLRAANKLEFSTRSLIASDALHIYAPLANRLGIWTLKWELEDLSFRYLEPLQYKAIAKALDERREDRGKRIELAKVRLRELLDQQNISAEVTGRPKHIYSIYRKMERKGIQFDEIFDAHALRIIIDRDDPELDDLSEEARKHVTYAQCYRALGIVHSVWESIPTEFDDYIQHPKPNGYRSLHTAIYDEDHKILEIQIRTRCMHEEAEQGFAAHWAYKEGGRPHANQLRQIESLRRVLAEIGDSAEDNSQPNPFEQPEAEHATTQLDDRVYVFTPTNDLIDLQQGATPLDFAYAIHTMVGHRTRGAKVKGKMVPLTYKLKSGDRVEIITFGKKNDDFAIGKPSRDWMNPSSGYVVSSRALNRVRAWFRKHERKQNIEYGRGYVERELKRLTISAQVTVELLAEKFKESADDFLSKVGFGDIPLAQLQGAIALIERDRRAKEGRISAEIELDKDGNEVETINVPLRAGQSRTSKGLSVMGMEGLHTRIARCCNPIPPEPIVGYVTRGHGVTIHHNTCAQVNARRKNEPERVVEANWGSDINDSDTYQVPFRIKAYRSPSLLDKIASVLGGQNVSLIKTKSTAMRNKRHINIFLLAEVKNLDQANWIAKKLGDLEMVYDVAR